MDFLEGFAKFKKEADLFVESVKFSEVFPLKKEHPVPYAYPCENYLESMLSNVFIRKALHAVSKDFCKTQIQAIKQSSLIVSGEKFPHFNSILISCCKSLDMQDIPEVFVTPQLKGVNALSIGSDDKPIVMISQKSLISLTDGELKFMLGHELGHIQQKNLVCHTIKGFLDTLNNKSEVLGSIISDMIEVPLNQWYRCAEYTADRAGYICCKDISHVISLFSKVYEKKSKTGHYNLLELYKSHPYSHNRIAQISEYAKTINYV